jgi:hypothetical protein
VYVWWLNNILQLNMRRFTVLILLKNRLIRLSSGAIANFENFLFILPYRVREVRCRPPPRARSSGGI